MKWSLIPLPKPFFLKHDQVLFILTDRRQWKSNGKNPPPQAYIYIYIYTHSAIETTFFWWECICVKASFPSVYTASTPARTPLVSAVKRAHLEQGESSRAPSKRARLKPCRLLGKNDRWQTPWTQNNTHDMSWLLWYPLVWWLTSCMFYTIPSPDRLIRIFCFWKFRRTRSVNKHHLRTIPFLLALLVYIRFYYPVNFMVFKCLILWSICFYSAF